MKHKHHVGANSVRPCRGSIYAAREQRNNQRGIALAVTLMILLILAVIAMSIGSIGIYNLRQISAYRDNTMAYYAAKAGVCQAIDALKSVPTYTTPDLSDSLSNNASYVVSFATPAATPTPTPPTTHPNDYSINNLNGSEEVPSQDTYHPVVPAGYAYVVGIGTCNNMTRRVAVMVKAGSSSPPWNYALFGYDSLSVGGTADITGDVGTNASSLTVGGSSTVSGDQSVSAGESQPAIVLPYDSAGTADVKSTCSKSPGNYGEIKLSSGETLTLSAGTYQFTDIQVTAGATISISSGPVYIYCTGNNFNLAGQSVTNTTGNAANCIFYSTSTNTSSGLTFDGGSSGYYALYAPNAKVKYTGGYDMHGSAIGKEAVALGTTSIMYDTNLESLDTGGGYLDVITWQNF